MKRKLLLILMLVMMFILTACTNKNMETGDKNTQEDDVSITMEDSYKNNTETPRKDETNNSTEKTKKEETSNSTETTKKEETDSSTVTSPKDENDDSTVEKQKEETSNFTENPQKEETDNSTEKPKKDETNNSTETTKPTHSHKYSKSVTKPTCTTKGYVTYFCSCGDSYKSDYTKAKGHTEVIDKAVAATTTSTGLTEGKHCSACGEVLVSQQVVDKIIEYFYTNDIQFNWNYKTGVTYSSLGSAYCEYQIESASCIAKTDKYDTSISNECSFTLKIKVRCKTVGQYIEIPYIIRDSNGKLIENGILGERSDTFVKGICYTYSDIFRVPLSADTYTITLGVIGNPKLFDTSQVIKD